jgi:lipoyl-dependent peroxiredoxin
MSKIQKVLLTGKTHTTVAGGAKPGRHDKVNLNLTASPRGSAPDHAFENIAAHPTAEQLFAGAWSACYTGALDLAAQSLKVSLPADLAVDIEVDLGLAGSEYLLQARLNVSLPGLDAETATAVAHAADKICPYSKAVRGNIDVALNVITA